MEAFRGRSEQKNKSSTWKVKKVVVWYSIMQLFCALVVHVRETMANPHHFHTFPTKICIFKVQETYSVSLQASCIRVKYKTKNVPPHTADLYYSPCSLSLVP